MVKQKKTNTHHCHYLLCLKMLQLSTKSPKRESSQEKGIETQIIKRTTM